MDDKEKAKKAIEKFHKKELKKMKKFRPIKWLLTFLNLR